MKMYCLIRKDLAKNYQGVQGGHAIAQYFIEHGLHDTWDNGTMIFLGVDNEEHLKEWSEHLNDEGINHSTFIEPDIGDELTALATIDCGKRFSNLGLLR